MKKEKKAADLKPRQFKNLTQNAYIEIRRSIVFNELKPGERIPYKKMAEEMNMTPTTILQGLKHIEFMGFIRHEQNRGFFIEGISPEDIEEIFRLRLKLEAEMLKTSLQNMDEQGDKIIEKAYDEYIEACHSGFLKLMIIKDIHFHMALASLSKQRQSIFILRYLMDSLYLRYTPELHFTPPSLEDAVFEITAVFKAVKARDLEGAIKALEKHISNTNSIVRNNIQNKCLNINQIDF